MRKHVTKKRIIAASIFIAIIALLFAAFYNGLTVRNYTISSATITSPVRIVLLADLHSHTYGNNQKDLVDLIKKQNPDIIMLSGDIADDETPIEGTELLLDGIKDVADIYYVTGNHEYWSSSVEDIKEAIRSSFTGTQKQLGDDIKDTREEIQNNRVIILSDEYVQDSINGNAFVIAGIEDPARTNYFDPTYDQDSSMYEAFSSIGELDGFKILLAHRPEQIEQYKLYDFDLILSGHAHGGQVRIPFILNGLIAPNQGLFPKYAGGVYEHDTLIHVVSRGLSFNSILPRVFNPPEVVVIDLLPG